VHDPACDNAFAKVSRHTACLFHQQSPILYRGRRQGRQPLNIMEKMFETTWRI